MQCDVHRVHRVSTQFWLAHYVIQPNHLIFSIESLPSHFTEIVKFAVVLVTSNIHFITGRGDKNNFGNSDGAKKGKVFIETKSSRLISVGVEQVRCQCESTEGNKNHVLIQPLGKIMRGSTQVDKTRHLILSSSY
jgi:hypothetical protein